jgi:hypothetical protein
MSGGSLSAHWTKRKSARRLFVMRYAVQMRQRPWSFKMLLESCVYLDPHLVGAEHLRVDLADKLSDLVKAGIVVRTNVDGRMVHRIHPKYKEQK